VKITRRTALAAAGVIASAAMAFGAIATLSHPQARVVDDSTWAVAPGGSTWDAATTPRVSVASIKVAPMNDSTW
jgi:hypothetical protein